MSGKKHAIWCLSAAEVSLQYWTRQKWKTSRQAVTSRQRRLREGFYFFIYPFSSALFLIPAWFSLKFYTSACLCPGATIKGVTLRLARRRRRHRSSEADRRLPSGDPEARWIIPHTVSLNNDQQPEMKFHLPPSGAETDAAFAARGRSSVGSSLAPAGKPVMAYRLNERGKETGDVFCLPPLPPSPSLPLRRSFFICQITRFICHALWVPKAGMKEEEVNRMF